MRWDLAMWWRMMWSHPPLPKLSEATQQYIKLRGMGKAKTFHQTAIRNSNVVIEILGDRNLREYSTVDAGKVRDALIKQGLNILSVKRTFIWWRVPASNRLFIQAVSYCLKCRYAKWNPLCGMGYSQKRRDPVASIGISNPLPLQWWRWCRYVY